MSRWKLPQAAAKQAGRAAKQAEKLRKEKRKNRQILIGVILLMLITWAAYFVFYAYPRLTKPHRQHQRAQTNLPAAPVSIPEPQRAGALTNHE